MNNMGVREDGKMVGVEVVDWFFDDWIDGNLIGHDPLIYIEGWSHPSRKPL
jgi:hypothetical protein